MKLSVHNKLLLKFQKKKIKKSEEKYFYNFMLQAVKQEIKVISHFPIIDKKINHM